MNVPTIFPHQKNIQTKPPSKWFKVVKALEKLSLQTILKKLIVIKPCNIGTHKTLEQKM
jgi:hypothetical protein